MDELIRKRDAINQFEGHGKEFWGTTVILDRLNALPAIEPKTKVIAQITFDEEKLREIVKETIECFKEEYEIIDKPLGEWIINWDDRYRKCTNWNKIWWFDYGSYNSDFCPNCGARMKEVDDEKPM